MLQVEAASHVHTKHVTQYVEIVNCVVKVRTAW